LQLFDQFAMSVYLFNTDSLAPKVIATQKKFSCDYVVTEQLRQGGSTSYLYP